jgi:D-alanyl-D-alanine carboxypeptidase
MMSTVKASTGISRRRMLLLTGSALIAPALMADPAAKHHWAALDALCEKALANRLAPGLSLSVMHAGTLMYSRGFGLANLETDTRVGPQTVFHIASVTKQFTGAAFGLLHEDGKLEYEDKLSRFLPDFPHAGDVTLRQMLTHTSGLGNFTIMESRRALTQAARLDYDERETIAAMRATSPLFIAKPGTMWAYSNTAYVLLGLVVQKITGEPFGDFFRKRLLDVAGLADTSVDDAATVLRGRASGYTPNANTPGGFDNASFISMTFPGAAGAMRSTTDNLCRWHQVLLGGRIVKPETLQEMTTAMRLNDGSIPTTRMDPEQKKPPVPMEYGFGLMLGSMDGKRFLGHDGDISGFASQLRSFPAEQISVALLVNADSGPREEFHHELESLRDAAARIAMT